MPSTPLPPFTPVVAALPPSVPFVGPETLERRRGAPFTARIGANESASGPSPRAREAMQAVLQDGGARFYGDPESHELRAALAERHGVAMEEIVVDAGIDTLLGVTARLFLAPGQTAVTSLGAYPTFSFHVAGAGAAQVNVPYRDDCEDTVALAAAAREHGARLVYLSNPDNPMGTCCTREEVEALVAALPRECLLLLDEAYIDYLDADEAAAINPPIDTGDPRVLRYRTFSKAWGMAGLRIGYAIGHREVIAGFERVRNHFGVNRLAQAAALASLQDEEYLVRVRGEVRQGRRRIVALAQRHGLVPIPSLTNFVTVDAGSAPRAVALMQALQEAGVFVRKPAVAPLDRCVRIGVGTPDELGQLESLLGDVLQRVDASLHPQQ